MNIDKLNKVIRINKNNLESELLNKKILLDSIESLEKHLQEMEEEFSNEQKIAETDVLSRMTYSNYYQSYQARKNAINIEIQSRKSDVAAIDNLIKEMHIEIKKFEKLSDNESKKKSAKEALEETKKLDEFNLRKL